MNITSEFSKVRCGYLPQCNRRYRIGAQIREPRRPLDSAPPSDSWRQTYKNAAPQRNRHRPFGPVLNQLPVANGCYCLLCIMMWIVFMHIFPDCCSDVSCAVVLSVSLQQPGEQQLHFLAITFYADMNVSKHDIKYLYTHHF
jgi:hypothetical protein